MPDFDDLSDSLKAEVLTEMANTYFGARSELDHLLEEFDRLTDSVAELARRVLRRAGLLHVLLLEERGVPAFYRAVGVDPESVPFPVRKGPVSGVGRMPFAFTGRGRWLKLVRRTYAEYQTLAHDYMHGHPVSDPQQPKRKRLSVNYDQLGRLARSINDKIRRVNEDLSMNDALEYAKRLEPRVVERERMAGGGVFEDASQLNKKDFEPIDFEYLGIRPVPELPAPGVAWRKVESWLKGFYRQHEAAVSLVMNRLAAGENPFNRQS